MQRQTMARKKQSEQTPENKTRILIVDDHPIVRQGLAELVNHEDDLVVCGQAEDSHEALRAIGELNPNMAVVDISLKETSGLELIKEIKKDGRFNTPLMMVTNYKDQMHKAIESGAVEGYGKDKLHDEKTVELLSKYLG